MPEPTDPTNVVRLPTPVDTILTKKQLAAQLCRSERWIEMRAKEGMPKLDVNRFGRRMYRLKDVMDWLERRPDPATVAERKGLEERISDLEAKVAKLLGSRDQDAE